VQQVHPAKRLQPLFLRMQGLDGTRAMRELRAHAGQVHDAGHPRLAQGARNGRADAVLRGAHVVLAVARRDHRVGRLRTGEGALQERSVGGVARSDFGPGPGQRRECAGIASHHADGVARGQQQAGEAGRDLAVGSEKDEHGAFLSMGWWMPRIVPACIVRKKCLLRNGLFRDTGHMNLARLEIFVTVCATGSFTRAADHLAITKSAASQQVATLERELGVQLLHRSTRSLALTEAGTALRDEAQALLDQAQRLAERTRHQAAQLTGLLRITSAEDTANWAAPVVAEYVRRHPGMQVEYRPSDRLLDLVSEGMDLSLRTTGRRDSSLRAVNLAVFDVWCVASPQYLMERGTPGSWRTCHRTRGSPSRPFPIPGRCRPATASSRCACGARSARPAPPAAVPWHWRGWASSPRRTSRSRPTSPPAGSCACWPKSSCRRSRSMPPGPGRASRRGRRASSSSWRRRSGRV
jgi:DNA-binding transcriptional LysR family regulator